MKILIAAPEAVPFAKTGGLADVSGTLLMEYRKSKNEACLLMPFYRTVRDNFKVKDTGLKITIPVEDRVIGGRIYSYGKAAYFIDCDEFFDRPELYGSARGDYADNASRFVFFSRGILEACKALKFMPDVIHCNDWQTGLAPLYLKTIYKSDKFFSKTASLITVHNLGYQGLFPPQEMTRTGLDSGLYNPEGIEFYGMMNFLKAGLISADAITTVSGSYANEILRPEHGFGLDGVMRKRASSLSGILNGIDYEEWNPGSDRFLPENYTSAGMRGKRKCRLGLLKDCGIEPEPNAPVVSFIGRLSAQKGMDLLLNSMEEIISSGAILIVLGKGDEYFHARLLEVYGRHRDRMYVNIGFDDKLAHRIYAGSDIFLMPSLYEPCGLGQMIAMRYGAIPVARKTGGLADTIEEYDPLKGRGTGFLFSDYTSQAFVECLRKALCAYTNKSGWRRLVSNAMRMDYSWKSSAKKYMELYKTLMKAKGL